MVRQQTAFQEEIIAERYLLQEQIGRGRMSAVYLARDLAANNAPVAAKILNTDHPDEVTRAVFKRETAALRRLHHPNIVGLRQSGLQKRAANITSSWTTCPTLWMITCLTASNLTQRNSISTGSCESLHRRWRTPIPKT